MGDEDALIDVEQTHKRLTLLHNLWTKSTKDLFGGADVLSLPFGSQIKEDEHIYAKTTCTNQWLFGVLVVDLLVVITAKEVFIVGGLKKVKLLEGLKKKLGAFSVQLMERSKEDNNKAHFDKILQAIKKSNKGKTLGKITKDTNDGTVCGAWEQRIANESFESVDIANGLALLLTTKDEEDQKLLTTSSALASGCMNWLQTRLEHLLTENDLITHEKLSEEIEDKLKKSKSLKVANVDADLVEPAFAPIVMSGGDYDLKLSAASNTKPLRSGVIVCSIGVRYACLCSNISRTFLIDPTPEISANYRHLLAAFNDGVQAMTPGAKCSAVYAAIKNSLQKNSPELASHLLKSCGAGIGLEFKETHIQIAPKCDHELTAGTSVNLRVGVDGLKSNSKAYAILISDTVLVTSSGARVLTDSANKQHHQVTYEEEGGDDGDKDMTDDLPTSRTRPKEEAGPGTNDEEIQANLARKLNEEARKRLLGLAQSNTTDTSKTGRDTITKMVAYQNISQLPKSCTPNKIYVDMERECVLVPINGTLVPFHVATIRGVTKPEELTQDNTHYTLRINFISPPASEPWVTEVLKQEKVFLKQLSYRCADSQNLNTVFRQLKELIKRYTQEQSQLKDKDDLVAQEDLVLTRGKPHGRLRNVLMRPNMGGMRKTLGELQAHENGFRFTSTKGQRIDILYSNIKHAFLQPARNDLIVLVHFHLKNPIMLARRKLEDIQFYEEVMEASADVSGRNGAAYDHDEKRVIKEANRRFQEFCTAVDEKQLLGEGKEFDVPFWRLGFNGVAGKTTSFVQPTVNCLVDLTEWPTTVITLSEIELVSLERVDFRNRNFDMVIVFKDYTKPVKSITAVAKDKIDDIKRWLSESRIKYYEGTINLQWNSIMKHVIDDPEEFFNGGGWEFLNMQASDSESGGESESEAFQSPVSSGSKSSDEYSDAASSSGSSARSLSSDEESGQDWSDLERDAMREDAGKSDDEDEDERPNKRQKTSASGKAKPRKDNRR